VSSRPAILAQVMSLTYGRGPGPESKIQYQRLCISTKELL
jgi:hypothetical protein